MVTGVETAGLILAAFPLLVSGLTAYSKGVSTIRDWHGYRRILRRYARDIEGERVAFLNTLEELFIGIARSEDEVKLLIENAGGPFWRKDDYDSKLRARLDRSYDIYLAKLLDLREALETLIKKLDIPFGKVSNTDDSDPISVQRELRRLKIAIKKNEYEELIRRIQTSNIFLQSLTQQSLRLEPERRNRRVASNARNLDISRARLQAKSAFDAIITGNYWKRGCCGRHVVNIRLDRGWEVLLKQAKSSEPKLRLSIYLDATTDSLHERLMTTPIGAIHSYRGKWRDVEVRSLNLPPARSQNCSVPEPPSTSAKATGAGKQRRVAFSLDLGGRNQPRVQQDKTHAPAPTGLAIPITLTAEDVTIEDICKTLTGVQAHSCHSRKRIGIFSGRDGGDHLEMIPLQVIDKAEHNITTLESLLVLNARQSNKPAKARISRKDRLALAMVLASSVLHLDGSWLKRHWRSRDVLFPQLQSCDPAKHHSWNYEDPFLSWALSGEVEPNSNSLSPPDDVAAAVMEAHRIRSAPLFALALALIELCFGQPFANLKEPGDDDPDEIVSDRKTASRLLPYVSMESGLRYGDVVQRCIDCPFNVRVASFENPEFRDLVFEHILMPLMEDLNEF